MEPETHRLDREAMIAGRLAVAERLQRETDEIVAAAAAKRRAHDEWYFLRMRSLVAAEEERSRLLRAGDAAASADVTDERLRAVLHGRYVVRGNHGTDDAVPPELAAAS